MGKRMLPAGTKTGTGIRVEFFGRMVIISPSSTVVLYCSQAGFFRWVGGVICRSTYSPYGTTAHALQSVGIF